jgi:sortase A
MRRHLRTLSTLLIVVGVLLLAEGAVTVLWQEPVSGIYSRIEQGRLDSRLATIEGETYTTVERKAITRLPTPQRKLSFAARALDRRADDGDPLGRVTIPRIGLKTVFVAGTDGGDLRKGPGHYPSTPLPGVRGTVAIAGHRTTYGAPFRKLDKLRDGDQIHLRMPYGNFTYKVERTRIVPPTATWVTQRTSYDRLVLSACHPLYSAAKRIVVFARLVSDEPRGATA